MQKSFCESVKNSCVSIYLATERLFKGSDFVSKQIQINTISRHLFNLDCLIRMDLKSVYEELFEGGALPYGCSVLKEEQYKEFEISMMRLGESEGAVYLITMPYIGFEKFSLNNKVRLPHDPYYAAGVQNAIRALKEKHQQIEEFDKAFISFRHHFDASYMRKKRVDMDNRETKTIIDAVVKHLIKSDALGEVETHYRGVPDDKAYTKIYVGHAKNAGKILEIRD